MKTSLIAATVIVALSMLVRAQSPVSVYVFTKADPTGLVDEDSKARTTAVAALTKTLSQSKVVQVATAPEAAAVQVEITKTETIEEKDGLSALNNAMNGAHNSETKKVQYRFATLRVGEYSTELKAHASTKNETPLSRVIEAWVKDNAARLANGKQ